MKDMTNDEIMAAIEQSLQDVADRFAWDSTPTDGSVHAELEACRRFYEAKRRYGLPASDLMPQNRA